MRCCGLTRVRPEGEGVEAAGLAHLIQHVQVGIHVVCVVGIGCRGRYLKGTEHSRDADAQVRAARAAIPRGRYYRKGGMP